MVQRFLSAGTIWELGFLTLLFGAETVGRATVNVCMLMQTVYMLSASSSHLESNRSCQSSETVKREPIPWTVSGKAGALETCTNSFPPQGEDEVWDFSPSRSGLCWVEGLTASTYMLFKPPSLFSEVPNLGSYLTALRFRQDRNQSGSLHKNQNIGCLVQSFYSLPRENHMMLF